MADSLTDAIDVLVDTERAKGAADMRERAAKLCDDKAKCHAGTTSLFGDEAAQQLAKAIRFLPIDAVQETKVCERCGEVCGRVHPGLALCCKPLSYDQEGR